MKRIVNFIPKKPQLEKKTKVAAYARVSSGKDAMLHSLSAQVSYYSKLIQIIMIGSMLAFMQMRQSQEHLILVKSFKGCLKILRMERLMQSLPNQYLGLQEIQ